MLQRADHFLSISYSFAILSAGGIDNQLRHAMVESIHGSLSQPCVHVATKLKYMYTAHTLSRSVILHRRLHIDIELQIE